jgi:hypothetical protein
MERASLFFEDIEHKHFETSRLTFIAICQEAPVVNLDTSNSDTASKLSELDPRFHRW